MAQELTEELKVFVTAEVNNAVSNLQKVDKQTKTAEASFKVLGKTITAAFVAKEIASFARESVNAWETQKQAVDVLNATLQATGATAWTSSKQLQEMAASLQQITNYGDESIIQMQSVLLGFKNIKGDTFEHATKAILDMATVMKMDLSSAAQVVGKALDDPINGITSLQRQGFRFSEAQKAVIQSLIDTGDTAAAQKIILDELDTSYGGTAQAALKATTQIKNAWGDLQKGIGSWIEGFEANGFTNAIVTGLEFIAESFANAHDNFAWLQAITSEDNFNVYYAGLTDVNKQIEASAKWIQQYAQRIDQLNEKIASSGYSKKQKEFFQEELASAEKYMAMWQGELQMLQDQQVLMQRIQQQKNEEAEAEAAIAELMHAIGLDYEKLSKDDPVLQLERYQQQLEKIAKDREALSTTTTGLDTEDALRQLEYNEKTIQSKMDEIREKLQNDGKKSWQEYFQDVTGISTSTFTTGQQAGQLFIEGLQKSFDDSQSLSDLLGKKFDSKAAIENQMADLEKIITSLLNIPADKIDEVYSATDASIQELIDEYRRLNAEKQKYENTETLEELNNRLQQLTMTERELFIAKLQTNSATEEEIAKARELYDAIEEAQKQLSESRDKDKEDMSSWESVLQSKLNAVIDDLKLFEENVDASTKTLANLGVSLASLSFSAVMQGIDAFGEALGKGETAGEGLQNALEEMAQTILNQLPTLFLQAGLTLVAQGQWPLGLSLMAVGLGSQALSGFNKGVTERAKANANGDVYGADGFQAFANGGAFTNQIVNSPTLFKYAKGSGFGTGLMGEAGPEAILPLKRGADGSLGVEASGSGSTVVVNVEVINNSAEHVETQETTDELGQKKIMVLIGAAVNQHISSGKADKAMAARYGLKAHGV